jgi:hypothetical protein
VFASTLTTIHAFKLLALGALALIANFEERAKPALVPRRGSGGRSDPWWGLGVPYSRSIAISICSLRHYHVEIRRVICSTIQSLSGVTQCAAPTSDQARGRFPSEQAAMKCPCLVTHPARRVVCGLGDPAYHLPRSEIRELRRTSAGTPDT